MIQNINYTNIYHPRNGSVFQRKPWLFSFHHRHQVLAGAMMVSECLLPKIKIRVNYVHEVVGSSIFICPQLHFFLTKSQIKRYFRCPALYHLFNIFIFTNMDKMSFILLTNHNERKNINHIQGAPAYRPCSCHHCNLPNRGIQGPEVVPPLLHMYLHSGKSWPDNQP